MNGRALLALFLLLYALPLLAAPPPSKSDGPAPAVEKRIHDRINALRREHGLSPLTLNASLTGIARTHSRRMSRERFFSHADPEGRQIDARLREAGLSYRLAGENLFRSENVPDPVDAAVNGWMKSPGHRANILEMNFTETGIGVWRSGADYHITQIFRRPSGRPARAP